MDRNTSDYLSAKRIASGIVSVSQGNGLGTVAPGDILADRILMPDVNRWYRLNQIRACSNNENTHNTYKNAIKSTMASVLRQNEDIVCSYVFDGGEVSVMYGARNADVGMMLESSLPECRMEMASLDINDRTYSYNGIITGRIRGEELSDKLVAAGVNGGSGFVALVAQSVPLQHLNERIENNNRLIGFLNRYSVSRNTYGEMSRYEEEYVEQDIVNAVEILKEENDVLLRNREEGFTYSIIRFGANDIDLFNRLRTILCSVNSASADRNTGVSRESVRCIEIPSFMRIRPLAVPYIKSGDNLYIPDTMVAIDELSEAFIPARRSVFGYNYINYHIDENSYEAFPTMPLFAGKSFEVGKISDSNGKALIPVSMINQHVFVTGSTGQGKTTTVKKLLAEAWKEQIPFIVFESAKKEYFSLIKTIPSLRVLSSGLDGNALTTDPFRPERGITIGEHADALERAIMAACEGEHPIPEALAGLLEYSYRKSGWEYDEPAYEDLRRPFPTAREVYENIDDYIRENAGYGQEVTANIRGALEMRIRVLTSGLATRVFTYNNAMTARELLSVPTVIEMEDYPEKLRVFLTNILLFKIKSYLKKVAESDSLKRIIVIEEAHNIFRKTIHEESTQAANNRYIENMLATVRASGTGIIISDQRPSLMSDAVIANTSVKILHAQTSSEDINIVGQSMGLTEFQIRKVRELRKGECLITLTGVHGVQRAKINMLEPTAALNAACHICHHRYDCKQSMVARTVASMNRDLLKYHVSGILGVIYEPDRLKSSLDRLFHDVGLYCGLTSSCCVLAEILNEYAPDLSFEDKRIIVTSYYRFLSPLKR